MEERRVEIQRGEWRREGQRWRGESEGEKQRDGEGRVKERRREGKQDRVEENGKHGVLVGMGANMYCTTQCCVELRSGRAHFQTNFHLLDSQSTNQ